MESLKLWSDGAMWRITSDDPAVKRLFGSDTLPTGWRASAPVEKVLTSLQQRNPGATISRWVACEGRWRP